MVKFASRALRFTPRRRVAAGNGDTCDGAANGGGNEGRTLAFAGDFAATFSDVTTQVSVNDSLIETRFAADLSVQARTIVKYGQASAVTLTLASDLQAKRIAIVLDADSTKRTIDLNGFAGVYVGIDKVALKSHSAVLSIALIDIRQVVRLIQTCTTRILCNSGVIHAGFG
jgi:hypothetical protein